MSDNPNEYAFDASSSYSLHIGSDVTGGGMGVPFTRHIKSIVFTKDKKVLFNLPQKLYVPNTYCLADTSELNGFENYEIYNVTDDVEAGTAPVDMTNLYLLSMNPAYAGYKISLVNGAYVISTLVAGDIVSNHYISPAEYDAKSAAEREHYREVPINLPASIDWDYLYSADSTNSSVNVGLVDGKYRLTESLESNDFQFHYSGGGKIVRYLSGAKPESGIVATKLADIRRQNGSSYIEGTLYYLPDSSESYRPTFGGVNGVEVNTETGTVSLSLRIAKSGVGYWSLDLPNSDSSSYNDYFDTYLFDCPSTIFGNATSSDFTEETMLSPGTGQPVGNGMFHYSGEIVYFDYNAPTPVDPTPVDPTPTATSEYVLCIDGVPIDLSLFSDVDGDVVLSLDKGSVHTATMVDTMTGQANTSATWRVNNNYSLPSGFSVSEGVLTIAVSSVSGRYHIEGSAEESTGSVDIYLPDSGITVADAGLGVGMALGSNSNSYIAFIDSDGKYKTTSNGNATPPVSLVSKDGLAITQDTNTGVYNITVPYDSVGYGFCVLDRNDIDDDEEMVVDASEGFANESSSQYSVMWGVTFPDARRATPRWRSWIPCSDAGTYDLTAFICGGNLAGGSDENTKWVQIVNSIRLTIQPIINVSWIAVSYEG